jgi:hypothetical protein
LEHCPEANTGEDTYSSFKRIKYEYGTEAYNICRDSTEKMVIEYMDYLDSFGMFHILIRDSMLFSHMYRGLKYEIGNKIHPHTDHYSHVYGSCTFNLNEDYTGGDFVFWNGKHRECLNAGDAMIFPADHFWVHEVEEIKSGVRYSTNSFLLNLPNSIVEDLQRAEDDLVRGSEVIMTERLRAELDSLYDVPGRTNYRY